MFAVDTNVIVRYLTADDPGQSKRARAIMDESDVWISTTVLLESEWVLRSVYDFPRTEVASALRRLSGLPHVVLEAPATAATALLWAEQGLDFADALHLAAADGREAFLTFDGRLARAAGTIGSIPVREP